MPLGCLLLTQCPSCIPSNTAKAITLYTNLLDQHPESNSLKGQLAETFYEHRNFDDAQALLEQLRKSDPYRLENMDTYSNILYVKELKPQLSYLAHETTRIDQYRVETCCVVGNYYSIKGRHEKAVLYFRRALKLDRKYLAAWTLMGHEYLELKNPPAAIEAYRRARCSVFDRNLNSRMPLGFTPLLRLKRCHACDQWHSSRVSTASYRLAL
jgi:anaphase-promoting complex subunit 8